jgi:prolyl-tRNA synthetase
LGKQNRTAITPRRDQDFPKWYQEVVKEAEMAEMAHVRGCMVIKPWGYGMWEQIQARLGDMIKACGAENAYFPLFIPLKYIQKEAEHVEGFAQEMAVVTHHRLEKVDGQLVPAGKLTEPLVVRPTSETIIGESFSKWINSYRDLPLKVNQWCNIVRWEMRPRVFLRTTEFLWQEGHTAFATAEEAVTDSLQMVNVYKQFSEEWLAVPVISGAKPAYDRFPGAVETYTIEAMMQDGKALQAGTSHDLAQNFSKAANISFTDSDGEVQFAHTTSWGVSTRLIGAAIMTHGDDDGVRVPPRIAPLHIVIVPIQRGKDTEQDKAVMNYADNVLERLKGITFADNLPMLAKVDKRLNSSTEKRWNWVKKGVPVQIEVGPRDIENDNAVMRVRSEESMDKSFVSVDDLVANASSILDKIQTTYFDQAKKRMDESITDLKSYEELEKFFKSADSYGFVRAPWLPSDVEDTRLKEMAVTIRCIPFEQKQEKMRCILTGEETDSVAIFSKAY